MKRGGLNPRWLLMLGAFGASWSSILVRVSQAPSLVIAAYRLLWTVLLLSPIVLAGHRAELKELKKRDVFFCASSGVFLALHFAAWFQAVKLTSVANSTVLVSTEVIFSALGYRLLFKGSIPRQGLWAMGITFGGSIIIALGSRGSGSSSWQGDLLALLAAVFVAVYTLIGRQQRGHMSTTIYTYLTYLFCAGALVLLAGANGTRLWGWGWREIGIGLLLSLCCTLMGHSIFSWCLKYLNPAYVSAMKLTEPVYASLLAALLFRELPQGWQILGALVVFGGVLLYSYTEVRLADADRVEAEAKAKAEQ